MGNPSLAPVGRSLRDRQWRSGLPAAQRRYASGSIEADIEPFERASSRSAPKA
jgi:hypothetical protein